MKLKFIYIFLLSLLIGETGEGYSNILTIDTVDPTIEVISSNDTEQFWGEEIITWLASDYGLTNTPIKIFFSYDNGTTYNDSTEFIMNSGHYNWTVPDGSFDSCKVKIFVVDEFGNTNYDESDSSFTIYNEFSIFSLLSPSSFTIDMTVFPFLEWEASFTRGIYDVWISESPMFNEELTQHHQTRNTYLYPPIDLKTNMTYFWKVSAEIGQDTIVADMGGADYWMFTTVPHTDFLHPMIDGEIQDHRTLIKENSPYYISQTPQTLAGKNLTIEPSVELLFDENTELVLGGNLVANGSEQDSIIFTGYNENNIWSGISFDDNSFIRDSLIVNENNEYILGNIINYVNIKNTSSILAENVEFYISNSSFNNLEGILVNIDSYLINNIFENGVSLDSSINMVNGGIYFENNVIQYVNGNGIFTLDNALFIDNTIQYCTGFGINGGNYFDNNQINNNGNFGINCSDTSQVINNSITDNGSYGLNGGITIYGNTISSNNGYAIHAGVNSAITNNTIENNIGYAIENGLLIDGNTITNNISCIKSDSLAVISNNIIENNTGFIIQNGKSIIGNSIINNTSLYESQEISEFNTSFDETSTQYPNSTGAVTYHSFNTNGYLYSENFTYALIEITVSGDYGSSNEYATVSIEGNNLGNVDPGCNSCTMSNPVVFSISSEDMIEYLEDGSINVTVDNSSYVSNYNNDYHTVRLGFHSTGSEIISEILDFDLINITNNEEVRNNIIENNIANKLLNLNSAFTIIDNNYINNNSSKLGLIEITADSIIIENNNILNNYKDSIYPGGPAITIQNTSLPSQIKNNNIINHVGGDYGGGIHACLL